MRLARLASLVVLISTPTSADVLNIFTSPTSTITNEVQLVPGTWYNTGPFSNTPKLYLNYFYTIDPTYYRDWLVGTELTLLDVFDKDHNSLMSIVAPTCGGYFGGCTQFGQVGSGPKAFGGDLHFFLPEEAVSLSYSIGVSAFNVDFHSVTLSSAFSVVTPLPPAFILFASILGVAALFKRGLRPRGLRLK